MAKEYFKQLQEDIELLQDTIDGKDLQAILIKSEMEDITKPTIAIAESNRLILDMFNELSLFCKSKGWNDKTMASRARLIRLLSLNDVSDMSNQNYRLKLANKEIHKNYQLLRIENHKLKVQINKNEASINF
jgi:hypothetical protein